MLQLVEELEMNNDKIQMQKSISERIKEILPKDDYIQIYIQKINTILTRRIGKYLRNKQKDADEQDVEDDNDRNEDIDIQDYIDKDIQEKDKKELIRFFINYIHQLYTTQIKNIFELRTHYENIPEEKNRKEKENILFQDYSDALQEILPIDILDLREYLHNNDHLFSDEEILQIQDSLVKNWLSCIHLDKNKKVLKNHPDTIELEKAVNMLNDHIYAPQTSLFSDNERILLKKIQDLFFPSKTNKISLKSDEDYENLGKKFISDEALVNNKFKKKKQQEQKKLSSEDIFVIDQVSRLVLRPDLSTDQPFLKSIIHNPNHFEIIVDNFNITDENIQILLCNLDELSKVINNEEVRENSNNNELDQESDSQNTQVDEKGNKLDDVEYESQKTQVDEKGNNLDDEEDVDDDDTDYEDDDEEDIYEDYDAELIGDDVGEEDSIHEDNNASKKETMHGGLNLDAINQTLPQIANYTFHHRCSLPIACRSNKDITSCSEKKTNGTIQYKPPPSIQHPFPEGFIVPLPAIIGGFVRITFEVFNDIEDNLNSIMILEFHHKSKTMELNIFGQDTKEITFLGNVNYTNNSVNLHTTKQQQIYLMAIERFDQPDPVRDESDDLNQQQAVQAINTKHLLNEKESKILKKGKHVIVKFFDDVDEYYRAVVKEVKDDNMYIIKFTDQRKDVKGQIKEVHRDKIILPSEIKGSVIYHRDALIRIRFHKLISALNVTKEQKTIRGDDVYKGVLLHLSTLCSPVFYQHVKKRPDQIYVVNIPQIINNFIIKDKKNIIHNLLTEINSITIGSEEPAVFDYQNIFVFHEKDPHARYSLQNNISFYKYPYKFLPSVNVEIPMDDTIKKMLKYIAVEKRNPFIHPSLKPQHDFLKFQPKQLQRLSERKQMSIQLYLSKLSFKTELTDEYVYLKNVNNFLNNPTFIEELEQMEIANRLQDLTEANDMQVEDEENDMQVEDEENDMQIEDEENDMQIYEEANEMQVEEEANELQGQEQLNHIYNLELNKKHEKEIKSQLQTIKSRMDAVAPIETPFFEMANIKSGVIFLQTLLEQPKLSIFMNEYYALTYVNRQEWLSLLPTQLLFSSIIDAWMQCIQIDYAVNRKSGVDALKNHESFFIGSTVFDDRTVTSDWFQGIQMTMDDLTKEMIIPFNIKNLHWIMATGRYDSTENIVYITTTDSLNNAHPDIANLIFKLYKNLYQQITIHQGPETYDNMIFKYEPNNPKTLSKDKFIQQSDSESCGIFTCMFIYNRFYNREVADDIQSNQLFLDSIRFGIAGTIKKYQNDVHNRENEKISQIVMMIGSDKIGKMLSHPSTRNA